MSLCKLGISFSGPFFWYYGQYLGTMFQGFHNCVHTLLVCLVSQSSHVFSAKCAPMFYVCRRGHHVCRSTEQRDDCWSHQEVVQEEWSQGQGCSQSRQEKVAERGSKKHCEPLSRIAFFESIWDVGFIIKYKICTCIWCFYPAPDVFVNLFATL